MIHRFNRSQTTKAVVLIIGGLFCCWLAFLFFRYATVFLGSQFRQSLPRWLPDVVGFAGLAASWVSGYRVWKADGGLFGYHESGLYHDLGDASAGAFMMDRYMHRVTGPAYLLGQVFMAGPLWILKSCTLLRSRIAYSPGLESALEQTLATLRAAAKWEGIADHPDSRNEIYLLARMGLIDFSAHKGTPRLKAR
ncbi:MAG: hypothetical protein RL088_3879 [Verrucomicrobiota bacterium]|jgi:hypothetical protein